MNVFRIAAAGLVLTLTIGGAAASSLRVSPIDLQLSGGAAATSVRLWNNDMKPVSVQVRIYRWTKVNGNDHLEATTDVVASPPMTRLAPGSENLIRVVRVTKRPLEGKESYRLLVDELPDPKKQAAGTINVVIRHSIPVRFSE